MNADPKQVDAHARRLVRCLRDEKPFQLDPEQAVEAQFGITVRYRSNVSSDCEIDGTFDHEQRVITVDEAAVHSRRRFTILHELGHALGREDAELQDWLFGFAAAGRREEERVANSFASLVLMPDDLVAEHIPSDGPCAYDVQQLADASSASREAACVRASQLLRGPGMVVLSRGQIVQLAITRGLPFGLRRNTDMGPDSFFARAAEAPPLRQSSVRLRFPDTQVESSTLEADAVTDGQGYTFSVLMEHSAPWVSLSAIVSGPSGHEIECEQCDRTRITFAAKCRRCGDRPCPDHGCACEQRPRVTADRRCQACNLALPISAPPTVVLCDMCG
ncbi:MAG: ImmA/IrrE family metallo-endopeptidase [Acidimicrobiia bacterium]